MIESVVGLHLHAKDLLITKMKVTMKHAMKFSTTITLVPREVHREEMRDHTAAVQRRNERPNMVTSYFYLYAIVAFVLVQYTG